MRNHRPTEVRVTYFLLGFAAGVVTLIVAAVGCATAALRPPRPSDTAEALAREAQVYLRDQERV